MTDPEPYSLADKYLLNDGIVVLSGVQALVRLPIDQHKTAIFGSQLAKPDAVTEVRRRPRHLVRQGAGMTL